MERTEDQSEDQTEDRSEDRRTVRYRYEFERSGAGANQPKPIRTIVWSPEMARKDEDKRPSKVSHHQRTTAIRGRLLFRNSGFQRTACTSMRANSHVRPCRCIDAVANESRSDMVDQVNRGQPDACMLGNINQFKPTRGRDEPIEYPSMRAVQTDPIDRSTIRSEDLKGDWTEDRSEVDTNSKDWALGQINRSRSDPSFGLPKWHERMKTGDHPK
jgi:hypothetical protein